MSKFHLWLCLFIGVLLIVNLTWECLCDQGFARLEKWMTRRQKIAVYTTLLLVAVIALGYGLFQYYR
jgi:hypothetical protein